MSREIRRASDNATGNALRPETVVKGYGEWPKLMFKHRAKGGIEARYDPCFFAAPPDKIVFVATVFSVSRRRCGRASASTHLAIVRWPTPISAAMATRLLPDVGIHLIARNSRFARGWDLLLVLPHFLLRS